MSFTLPVAAFLMISKEEVRNRDGDSGKYDCTEEAFSCLHGMLNLP
jgi:hypothetical protein